jgi:heterodisulfide reductase subunit D
VSMDTKNPQSTTKRHIDAFEDVIYSCNRCGQCFDVSWLGTGYDRCPAYKHGLFESYGARGKFNIARALVDGVIDYDADIAERVYACTDCRACAAYCFKFLDTVKVWRALKADLAERDLLPINFGAAVSEDSALAREHNVYDASHAERLDWLPSGARVDAPADTVFFVGCTAAFVRHNMAIDTWAIMNKAKADFTVLGDEWCCGHPYLEAGLLDEARQVMEHNIELITSLGANKVVFNCPGCLQTFKTDAPELLGYRLPFESVHILEEIDTLVEQGRVEFGVHLPKAVVTYHDPCPLGRGLGVYDAPRAVLKAIPGLRLVEMARHGEDAYCCGAGGLIRYDYAESAAESGSERLREAELTGADTLVTACPACLMQFQQVRNQLRSRLKVVDITQLINSQMR